MMDVIDHRPQGEENTVPHEPKDIHIATFNPQGHVSSGNAPPLVFAHGAGGGMYTDAVVNFRDGFVSNGHTCTTFNGTMHLGNRVKAFKAVAEHATSNTASTGHSTALGGRSMGARAAAIAGGDILDSAHFTKELVLVSYPLTNAKGEVRDQILLDIDRSCSVIFVSGDRDSMCDLQHLNEVRAKMSCPTWMVTVAGADHGMNAKPKSATREITMMTGRVVAEWFSARNENATEGHIALDTDTNTAIWSGWKAQGEDHHRSKSESGAAATIASGKATVTSAPEKDKTQKKRKSPATKAEPIESIPRRRSTRIRAKHANID